MTGSLANAALKAILNHKFKNLGEIVSLNLDPKTRSVAISANLAGEIAPIDLTVNYAIEKTDDRSYFIPQKVECSRRWVTLLAAQLMQTNTPRIEIPRAVAPMALKVLEG
ncbi:MAG: hypothetical protein ABI615_03395 [Chthoniobacterales bacterium]